MTINALSAILIYVENSVKIRECNECGRIFYQDAKYHKHSEK